MLNTDRLCPGCMNDNGGEQICSICGYDSSEKNGEDRLPVRFRLYDRFMVGRELDSNSEGITYIGWDNVSDCAVRVREYFPDGAAVRNPDCTVSMQLGQEYTFNEGLMDFLEINKKLIGSELPSLIPTLSVFEENGTAYAVSAAYSGITLKDFLSRNGGSLKWEQVRPLFLPLIDTVKGLHEHGIIHGGISPETILVGRDGKFRITEISIPGMRFASNSFTAQVYNGYAAAEQYGFENMSVGEYTDVYGLCATLFRVLIGTVPPGADERVNDDRLSIPAKFADELPRQVLVAMANGLQVMPKERTSSIETLRNELVYGETQENVRRAANRSKEADTTKKRPEKKTSGAKYAVISAVCTVLLFGIVFLILSMTVLHDQVFGKPDAPATSDADSYDTPSVDSVGSMDSNAVESKQLYAVPELLGKYYSQIIDNEEYERFKFTIKGKEYSKKYARGTICAQSVDVGTNVEKDTEIAVTISLGSEEIKVANVLGLTAEAAKIELLKQGFLYDNIEVVDKYDSDKKPGIVLEQSPEYGTQVNTETVVRICINSYTGEESETESGSSQNFR